MLLYFVPGAKALTPQVIADHGLAHLEGKTACRETFQGPRGAGLLIAANTIAGDLLQHRADQQTWSERFGLDSLVGTWNDHPVTPQSLARENQVTGPSVRLLDGQFWTIPLLRQWRPGDDALVVDCKLPRVMQQSPVDGRFILGAVIPTYRTLWENSLEIAQQVLSQVSSGTAAALDDAVVHRFVIDLLSVNYRLDASVVSHLQLLTPNHCGEIVCAALDLDTLRASLKNLYSRRTSGGTNTASGNPPPPAG